ncbi:aspartate dehydrogenase [Ammoniphilus sp. YIM 78166]|uniref:aspartate dehydrogenase n=1 Tax=Ammoniphilus sp. YIM 78166 TaxID=1644106 RepID=UPI0010705D3F|nr:aspartate dehydrogenase [Ammoniphilus sp. YIM 78166]
MKIGLIGCGNIGKFLLHSLNNENFLPDGRITAVYSSKKETAALITREYQIDSYTDFEAFLHSDLDLIIEAATIQVVEDYARPILESGKDMLIISVGALADRTLHDDLRELCRMKGTKVYLPSGAIGGLDVLKAAMTIGQLESVSITTRKPPKALSQDTMDAESIIFEGSAREAIQLFPQNINVSIILSLAGLGPERTSVKIIADPKVDKNTHSIEAKGTFGKLTLNVENDPMPNNPKTSYLAALSVLSTLKNRDEMIRVG